MPQITDIKTQQKNKNKLSIYIDNKYSFSLTIAQLSDEKNIRIGKVITDEEVSRLKKVSSLTNQYLKLINLIYVRPRSEYEIKSKLKQKKLDPDEIDELINQLKEGDYINDTKFTEWWVSSRKLTKPISSLKLKAELTQKGIHKNIIDEVISNNFTQQDEMNSLKELIDKKKSKYEDPQKFMSYLASKGFKYSQIKEALENTNQENYF